MGLAVILKNLFFASTDVWNQWYPFGVNYAVAVIFFHNILYIRILVDSDVS